MQTNDSMTLLIVGVNDIGFFISDSTDSGGFIFGIVATFALFQIVGTTPAIDCLQVPNQAMRSLAIINLAGCQVLALYEYCCSLVCEKRFRQ